jgi:hypothetical protein
VKSWAKLLKKGGRMIFDVPAGDSMLKGLALERIADPLGVLRRYTRESIDSEKVRMLLTDAGLDDGECFVSESYGEGEILRVERAGDTFDAMVREKTWVRGWHDELEKPGVMVRARELFCREVEQIAQGEGQVGSWLRFYMAAGRKIE